MQYADRTGRSLGGSTLQDRFLENLYASFLGRMLINRWSIRLFPNLRRFSGLATVSAHHSRLYEVCRYLRRGLRNTGRRKIPLI